MLLARHHSHLSHLLIFIGSDRFASSCITTCFILNGEKVPVMITSSFVVCYLLNLIGLDSVPSCIGSSGNNIDWPVLNVYFGHSFIRKPGSCPAAVLFPL